jgi:hypothetical protein
MIRRGHFLPGFFVAPLRESKSAHRERQQLDRDIRYSGSN